MATANATDLTSKVIANPQRPNSVSYRGTITATPGTGDKWNLCVVPAGVIVDSLLIANADLGTAAPATAQLAPIDGTSVTTLTATDALALGTASTGTLVVPTATKTTKDCYLQLLFGTINTGASGAVTVVVQGEGVGAA